MCGGVDGRGVCIVVSWLNGLRVLLAKCANKLSDFCQHTAIIFVQRGVGATPPQTLPHIPHTPTRKNMYVLGL